MSFTKIYICTYIYILKFFAQNFTKHKYFIVFTKNKWRNLKKYKFKKCQISSTILWKHEIFKMNPYIIIYILFTVNKETSA